MTVPRAGRTGHPKPVPFDVVFAWETMWWEL